MIIDSEPPNILGMTAKLAFIQKLDLPRDLLATTGKTWMEQVVRRVGDGKNRRCGGTHRLNKLRRCNNLFAKA
ncbi:hypothetical protein [Rhizobium sp. LEGMi135b]